MAAAFAGNSSSPPAYPLGSGVKAAIVADWAYHLTIQRVSITNTNIGIYMKGVDNAKLESNVIRANHCIIAEDCGDSTFVANDLYPFGWGFIFRAWSGDSMLLRNVVTGMPLHGPQDPGCEQARKAFPGQPERQCDEPVRLPASGGVLIDNEAESCGWENQSAVFAGLWPQCPGLIRGQGHATALSLLSGQFHGLREAVASNGEGAKGSRQVTLRGNNFMAPLGVTGFRSTGAASECELEFPCELCVCENNIVLI